jgi:hypothetical protein
MKTDKDEGSKYRLPNPEETPWMISYHNTLTLWVSKIRSRAKFNSIEVKIVCHTYIRQYSQDCVTFYLLYYTVHNIQFN